MRVFEVELFKGAKKYCEADTEKLIEDIRLWADILDIGEEITIKGIWMDEEKYNTLNDFRGP